MRFRQGEFVVTQKVAVYDEPAVRANKILSPNGTHLFVDELANDANGSGWWKVHDVTGKPGFIFDSTQGYFVISAGADTSQGHAGAPLDPALVGIGGWLIFPALAMVFSPLVLLISMVVIGSSLTPNGSSYAVFVLFIQLCLFGYSLVVAVRFFRKRRTAPDAMIVLMVAGLAASLLLAMTAPNDDVRVEQVVALVKSAIPTAIWIPYLRKSRRVKATFVQ